MHGDNQNTGFSISSDMIPTKILHQSIALNTPKCPAGLLSWQNIKTSSKIGHQWNRGGKIGKGMLRVFSLNTHIQFLLFLCTCFFLKVRSVPVYSKTSALKFGIEWGRSQILWFYVMCRGIQDVNKDQKY